MNRRIILFFAAAFLSVPLSALACELGSRRQVRAEGTVTAVQQDRIEIDVRRTPIVVIGGKEFVETIDLDEIQRVLDDLLGKSPASR